MKFVLVTLILSLSTSAFAISNSRLVETCKARGTLKLTDIASVRDCQLDTDDIHVDAIDNRMLNPSKYLWFSGSAACGKKIEVLKTMVQYDVFSRTCI